MPSYAVLIHSPHRWKMHYSGLGELPDDAEIAKIADRLSPTYDAIAVMVLAKEYKIHRGLEIEEVKKPKKSKGE